MQSEASETDYLVVGAGATAMAQTVEKRMRFATPAPSPAEPVDWLRMWGPTLRNTARWRQRPDLDAWLRDCSLI